MFILRKIYEFFVDTAQTILLAASVFLIIYIFFFRPYQVSGDSMYPTFKDKEYILTNLIGLHFDPPKRGDVVVFVAPTDHEKDFIKRVIGLPGEKLYLKDGSVFINGKRLDESAYLTSDVKTYGGSFLQEDDLITIPKGDYVVMGDNRPFSSDSREWGYLQESAIIGRAFFVYWPLNVMRGVKNPYQ